SPWSFEDSAVTGPDNLIARGPWHHATVKEQLLASSVQLVDERTETGYWQSAVDASLLTDDEILAALAGRTGFAIASELLVSSQARDIVSERLARRYEILPLAASDSMVEIATSSPYDLDCETTIAFATGRAVRMTLAA